MKLKTIYRVTLPVLGFLAVANSALAVYVFVRVRSPISYNVQVVQPQIVPPTITNETSFARSGLLPSPVSVTSVSVPSPRIPESWRMPYHYCVVANRRVAVLNGVQVYEGDKHAYGVVRDIYPERIYFEGGNYIDNAEYRRVENVPISN